MDIPIEEIVFLVNGVEHYLWGHVFEETDEALQIASRVAIFDSKPGKTGTWYQKDTIKSRRVISTVNSSIAVTNDAPATINQTERIIDLDADLMGLLRAGWKVETVIPSTLYPHKYNYSATLSIDGINFCIYKQGLLELYEHMMLITRAWDAADPKPEFRHEGEKEVWLRKLLINRQS